MKNAIVIPGLNQAIDVACGFGDVSLVQACRKSILAALRPPLPQPYVRRRTDYPGCFGLTYARIPSEQACSTATPESAGMN